MTVDVTPGFLRGQEHPRLHRPPRQAALDVCFLDRDGTLNVLRPGYRTVADFDLLDGAPEAVARLNASGIPVVLVTNQQGLGTGRLSWDELEAVHLVLCRELAARGAWLDDIRVCPHVAGSCTCRKPRPGLLEASLRDNPWASPARCLVVGDAESDVLAAAAVGIPSRRVTSHATLATLLDPVLSDIHPT